MIRLAVAADYPAICAYLETHWRKGHIFTTHKALFDWQHWDAARERYNFILGCAPNGDVQGVLGFIPHGQFDPELGFDSIWLCIWHASVKGTGLGRRMLDWLEETFKPTFLATNGASEMSLPLYQARGWETGKLEHWYMAPPFDRKAARGWESGANGPLTVSDYMPRKSGEYIDNRYLCHPVYRYEQHTPPLISQGRESLVILRPSVAGIVRGIRIVDVIGNPNVLLEAELEYAALEHRASFIDIYCTGIPSSVLQAAGFTRRIADEVIIPNYFEPYEHRNVDINYAVKAPKGMPWRVVKGDGDGDRPNVLP